MTTHFSSEFSSNSFFTGNSSPKMKSGMKVLFRLYIIREWIFRNVIWPSPSTGSSHCDAVMFVVMHVMVTGVLSLRSMQLKAEITPQEGNSLRRVSLFKVRWLRAVHDVGLWKIAILLGLIDRTKIP